MRNLFFFVTKLQNVLVPKAGITIATEAFWSTRQKKAGIAIATDRVHVFSGSYIS